MLLNDCAADIKTHVLGYSVSQYTHPPPPGVPPFPFAVFTRAMVSSKQRGSLSKSRADGIDTERSIVLVLGSYTRDF